MEETETTFTEAPLSVHIDAYFKGFHAGLTIRSEDNTVVPIDRVKATIEQLIKAGFEPSWNAETSKQHLEPTKASKGTTGAAVQLCGVHGIPMKFLEGISKKNGRPYAFWSCPAKNADGSFCNWKPVKEPVNVPVEDDMNF